MEIEFKILETAAMFGLTRNDERVIESLRIANIALADGFDAEQAYEAARVVLTHEDGGITPKRTAVCRATLAA